MQQERLGIKPPAALVVASFPRSTLEMRCCSYWIASPRHGLTAGGCPKGATTHRMIAEMDPCRHSGGIQVNVQ
ncbi:hypothetical protein MATL_G00239750 [Megalops atlanticus]|uniref:Uncharacterized protein n=1 Tax=Megalops atlanticus TaxID=7932 RepID=A0A9D3T168_MEGAT|nr:hypothetical protein MATL_G00239750 [Megalops atlanticus]